MKNRFSVAIAMIALTVSLAQARGQEWFGRWGTNDAEVQIAKKAQAKQAKARQIAQSMETASASLLPDRLPIGDEMTLRAWDVSTNSIELLVWIQLSFYQTNGTWASYNMNKFTNGYASFDAFVSDVTNAGARAIATFKANPDKWAAYVPGSDMAIDVVINYFSNDPAHAPVAYTTGFWTEINAGPFSGITPDSFKQACYADDPYEDAVINIPALASVEIAVCLPNETNRLIWNIKDGLQTSGGWPTTPYVNATTSRYLCLDGWFSLGQYPMYVTLTATNGETATYTRYGDRLVAPVLKMLTVNSNIPQSVEPPNTNRHAVVITVPRGSVMTLYSSLDLKNWSAVGTYRSGTNSTLSIPVIGSQSQVPSQFFRARCCVDLQ